LALGDAIIALEGAVRKASTSIDDFGRIVIPKSARERYGLTPGTRVDIDQSPDGIVLRPAEARPTVARKNGVLVFTGAAEGNIEDRIAADRAERARRVGLPGRR
jgi:AbrB family looped-hinge helix DNA binding protein